MLKNTMKNTIVENRYIGKIQLTADDMGGAGCDNWNQYRQICDRLAKQAYDHAVGRAVDKNALGVYISAIFEFFGVDTIDSSKYHARILATMVERKPQSSQTLKDARKAKTVAKKEWEQAITNEETEEKIAELKAVFEEKSQVLEDLYLEPKNYWYDLVPMLDKTKRHATAKARKALEDTCADIISERQLMSIEELEAEAVRLADERKGRKLRKKEEEKAKAVAEKTALDTAVDGFRDALNEEFGDVVTKAQAGDKAALALLDAICD